MRISGTLGATVRFRAYQMPQPPTFGGDALPLQLSGMPAIYRAADGTYPASVALSADHTELSVSYAGAPINGDDSFLVGPYDPALRTSLGGWIAPGIIAAVPPDAAYIPYNAVLQVDGTVTVTLLSDNPPVEAVFDPMKFRHVEGAAYPAFVRVEPFLGIQMLVTLTYGIAPVAGEAIQYTGPDLRGNGSICTQPDRVPHVL